VMASKMRGLLRGEAFIDAAQRQKRSKELVSIIEQIFAEG
jgi:hypothetical protein